MGVNMELPGLPLNASIHAEQCLITNMVLHGEQSVSEISISAAPCGHCRQFMCELVCAVGPRLFPTLVLERCITDLQRFTYLLALSVAINFRTCSDRMLRLLRRTGNNAEAALCGRMKSP